MNFSKWRIETVLFVSITLLVLFLFLGRVFHRKLEPSHTITASPIAERQSQPITLLFGGDLMFDRSIRQLITRRGGDFLFASSGSRSAKRKSPPLRVISWRIDLSNIRSRAEVAISFLLILIQNLQSMTKLWQI